MLNFSQLLCVVHFVLNYSLIVLNLLLGMFFLADLQVKRLYLTVYIMDFSSGLGKLALKIRCVLCFLIVLGFNSVEIVSKGINIAVILVETFLILVSLIRDRLL